MKKIFLILALITIACIAITPGAYAAGDESALEGKAAALDKKAGGPEGEKPIVERLEKEFKVDDARIKSLRDKKLGYGEIAIALSLAEKMPGGITDANVDKIMSMRKGPPVEGWGNIAKKLGTKLGPVISRVERVGSGKEGKDTGKARHKKDGENK